MGESDSDGLSDDSDDGEDGDSEDSDDDFVRVNKDVMEVGEMPRTDKQIRKERRRKLVERNERREAKRRKKSENEFDEVPVENAKDDISLLGAGRYPPTADRPVVSPKMCNLGTAV